MSKIAVLGGGGTGIMMAVDQSLKGHQVAIWDQADAFENLQDIIDAGSVEITGRAVNGSAAVAMITSDLAAAVEGADVILIGMIATRHEELADQLAPLLKDGQTICFSAGNCGSIILRRALAGRADVVIGEMQGNIYPCRLIGPAKVKSAFPYMPKKVAAFPGRDTARLIANLAGVYECVPAKNVLEATFNSPNISVHLAGCILNTAPIDKDPQFALYRDGITPSVLKCMEQVEAEKTLVMERMKLINASHTGMIANLLEHEKHPELADFRMVSGPDSMSHRYISEDAYVGQPLMISLARQLGYTLPCMEALVTLASVINGTDYMAGGRTTQALGMGGMSAETINDYLENGG